MEEILNSSSVNNVRFRMSKPQGYYTEDVDKFIDEQVKSSLTAYELTIKELQTNNYSLELQVKELNDEMSTLRIKADFSSSQALADEDSLLAESINKNETLQREIFTLKARQKELEEALVEWEKYAEEVQAVLSERTDSGPNREETLQEAETNYAQAEIFEEEAQTPTYEEPETVYAPEPVYNNETVHNETLAPEPVEQKSKENEMLSNIMLSVESEISEEELQKILAEEGMLTEEEMYGTPDKVKPEDL